MTIPIQELEQDILNVQKQIKRLPTVKDYQKYGKYGLNTIKRRFGKWNIALITVFNETNRPSRKPPKEIKCDNCKNLFFKNPSSIKTHNFCCQSCAAQFNNKKRSKKPLSKQCKCCNKLIPKKNSYCSICISKGKHLRGGKPLAEKTIEEACKTNDANRYNNIRDHARRITRSREQICYNCQYNKHVETCHIKDISDFDIKTKIKIVNDPKNLVLLCSNCHWELHNNLLKL